VALASRDLLETLASPERRETPAQSATLELLEFLGTPEPLERAAVRSTITMGPIPSLAVRML